ncbi:MAG: YhgE/Pip family protein [Coriobacteriales bacterium]
MGSSELGLLRKLSRSSAEELSTVLSAPVKMNRVAVYPVENFGSAMTPLYASLPLWVASFLIMATLNVLPRTEGRQRPEGLTAHQHFIGRFGVVCVISLMQSTLMGLGFLLFLGVQAQHPLLFMIAFWVAGLSFSAIAYTLVALLMSLGKALCVVLLVTQVSGSGGSFATVLLPGFLQTLSPILPVTHSINAMREAMFGTCSCDYLIELGILACLGLAFILMGLAPHRQLDRFVQWLFGSASKSGLM